MRCRGLVFVMSRAELLLLLLEGSSLGAVMCYQVGFTPNIHKAGCWW